MVAEGLRRQRDTRLRVGIVGLGKMGALHLQTWQRLSQVSLTALADCNPARADWAKAQGCVFCSDSHELAPYIDIAIIATPTWAHLESTLPLLAAGVHCLVEKPLALDFAVSRKMVASARQHQVLLAVGHSERFNPAIHLARAALAEEPDAMEIIRMVPRPSASAADSDVVQDLMVHDLDWLLAEFGQAPSTIHILEKRRSGEQLSHVSCELVFPGRKVRLTASCLNGTRRREIRLPQASGGCRVINLDPGFPQQGPDALTRQALAFLQALQGAPSDIALGEDVLTVMNLSDQIRRRCATTEAVVS